MKRALAIAVLVLPGCAKLLGLEDTEYTGAGIDAPSACDGLPVECSPTTGRSLCGQLFTAGPAGAALRVAAPTAGACAVGSTEGPCAFAVAASSKADYFAGVANVSTGTIDDCGRFVIKDFDPAVPDVVVAFTAVADYKQNATLVTDRMNAPGVDSGLEAYAVSEEVATGWSMQVSPPSTPVDVSSGFLVRYTAGDMPVAGVKVAKDMGSALTTSPGTTPWAAFFSAGPTFGTLDTTLMSTQSVGTAYLNFGSGTFSVDGVRTGARCSVGGVAQIANTFVFLRPTRC